MDWLLPLLPRTYSYVEVFGGSGAVLLNRQPSRIETFNDINSDVVNFFKVLREKPIELMEQIYFTPLSREEYYNSIKFGKKVNDVERARLFFVAVNQGFSSVGKSQRNTGWGYSSKTTGCMISETVNRWLKKLPKLNYVIERLKTVQIHNIDFRELIKRFDGIDVLFYCDPPYPHNTRTGKTDYGFEMTEEDHLDLLKIAQSTKGKIAISSYENKMYDEELKRFYKTKAKVNIQNIRKSPRQEVLYTNYDPKEINRGLFG